MSSIHLVTESLTVAVACGREIQADTQYATRDAFEYAKAWLDEMNCEGDVCPECRRISTLTPMSRGR